MFIETILNEKGIILSQHILISFVGAIGNFLVLLVYRKKLHDTQIITFLICQLAIVDLICCLVLIPINCFNEINEQKTNNFMCRFHTFL